MRIIPTQVPSSSHVSGRHRRRLRSVGLLVTVSVLVLGSCSAGEVRDGQATVVVSTSILADVVLALAGDMVDVVTLIPAGADPHEFSLSSADVNAIGTADLLIVNGLGLEEGMLDVVRAAHEDGVPLLEVAPLVSPIEFSTQVGEADHGENEGDEHGDESEGDEHGLGSLDPHFWQDPVRMGAAVDVIVEALVEYVPGIDEIVLRSSAEEYQSALADMDAAFGAQIAAVPKEKRVIVTNHDSLGYLAARYDIDVIGVVIPGGGTLASPNSAELAALVALLRETDVRVLFAENIGDTRTVEAVALELGGGVEVVTLFTDALGPGDTYLQMLSYNFEAILEAVQ